MDIGPKTRALFSAVLARARTVVWNGPLGVFEIPALREGTLHIANALADITSKGAFTVVGGGDTAYAIGKSGVKVSHVSTGGYASLQYLEGKTFAALEVLTDAPSDDERKRVREKMVDRDREREREKKIVDKERKREREKEEKMVDTEVARADVGVAGVDTHGDANAGSSGSGDGGTGKGEVEGRLKGDGKRVRNMVEEEERKKG